MPLLLLSQADVERLLDPAAMLDVLAQGFADLSSGKVVAPGRNGIETPDGFLLAMPGWVAGSPVGVKLVAAYHGNPARGLPGHQALISLFDPETGTPLVVMDGTHVTALRTAGGAALTTRLLARPDARVLAIIGGGVQALSHAHLLPLVRDIAEIRVWARDNHGAERVAAVDDRCRVVATAEEAVRDADIVCLCTSATEPPVGNAELQGIDPAKGTEVGEVILGLRPGRESAEEITVYKSMGHAMEDVVTAGLVYQAALAEGVGTTFAMENRA